MGSAVGTEDPPGGGAGLAPGDVLAVEEESWPIYCPKTLCF